MNKKIIISLSLSLIIIFGGVLWLINLATDDSEFSSDASVNVEIIDGTQYVTILASGGYSPGVSVARAGLPTKLIVNTNGTYDCSAALVIRQASFRKILKPTGQEVIDLGTYNAGDNVQGTCSMGMYNFKIKFE